MTDPLGFVLTVVAAGTGLVVLGLVAVRRYRWRRMIPLLVLLELGVLGLAVADGIGLRTGSAPAEPVTHLAYLAVVVLILPLAASQAARERNGPWGGVLVAVALLVLAVLIVRLISTGRPGPDRTPPAPACSPTRTAGC